MVLECARSRRLLHNMDNLPEDWFIEHQAAMRTVRKVFVFLADDEWGSGLMEDAAREAFSEYPDAEIAEVHEHAGWYLTWHRDGHIVATANDGWAIPDHIRGWWELVEKTVVVGTIRRQERGGGVA